MHKRMLVSSFLGLLVTEVCATNAVIPLTKNFFDPNNNYGHVGPWTPRFTSQGLLSRSELAGFVDGMVPVLGNNDRLFYLDGGFMGGRNQSAVASLGAGIRSVQKISPAEVILGGFFFADYQRMNLMNSQLHTWLANPGLELLTKHQEARVQGYFPMGQRSQAYRAMMASEMPSFTLQDSGKSNVLRKFGHTFIDAPVNLTHEYGVGVEAELGQYLPIINGAWLRGGVYHFDYRNAQSINGVEANLEVFTGKNFSLLVQDNYDNQNKNWFSVGVRLSFGGPDYTEVKHLRNRMEEPVIRHIARQPEGAATPIRESFVITGPEQITNDIWFFSPTGTDYTSFSLDICTAEHPCQNLNQAIADGITAAPGTSRNLWFASGSYVLPMNNGSRVVYLGTGQVLSGRSADFSTSATAADRPTIDGGLWWKGNGFFQDINISNNGQSNSIDNYVVALGAANNLEVKNATINTNAQGAITFGAQANNDLVLNAVTISANGNEEAIAAAALNGITINDSKLDAVGAGSIVYAVYGNQGAGGKDIVVKNSQLNASSTSADVGGIYSAMQGRLITEDTIITVKSPGLVAGINNDGGTVEALRTTIRSESSGSGSNGIVAKGNIVAQTVKVSAKNTELGKAIAIVSNEGDVSVADSIISAYSAGGTVAGIASFAGNIALQRTTVNSETKGGSNIYSFGVTALGTINAQEVAVTAINDHGQARGIESDGGDIRLIDSTINVFSDDAAFGVYALTGNVVSIGNTIFVQSSTPTFLRASFGIRAENTVTLDRTEVTVENTHLGVSVGVSSSGGTTSQGGKSIISVNTFIPILGLPINGAFTNNSVPQSECFNHGGQVSC